MPVLVHPAFAAKLQRIEARAASEGIRIIWKYGYRSRAYQQELLDCWNDPTNDYECRKRRGLVARPAMPGLGTHNLASGVDFDTIPAGKHARVGAIAKEEGCRWGGDFARNFDPVHIDDRKEFTLAQLQARFREDQLVDISVPA